MNNNDETVKLIVTLSKGQYENLNNIRFGSLGSRTIVNAVKNGTPLDSVKKEFINLYPKNYAGEPELGGAACHFSLCKILEILDNIGRSESEDV